MQIYRFDSAHGREITHFDSNFVMSPVMLTSHAARIGCAYLNAGGIIGMHEAVGPQLLMVICGEGWVRGGAGERVFVSAGDAVYWEDGEQHETYTESGLTAIIIESEEIHPERFMQRRNIEGAQKWHDRQMN